MKTLIENLYANNVIFSYYGFIDSGVLGQVLEITRAKLADNQEPPELTRKVCDAINECVNNIIRHNFYEYDAKVRYKSLLVVSRQNEQYHIDTINVVNAAQRESINGQLHYLQSRSHEELLNLKQKSRTEGSPATLSSGLLDLVLKADSCDCTFKDLDDTSLFNINYKVNWLN